MARSTDCFTFRRDFEGHVILVTAHFIPNMQTWGLMAKVNGTPVDHRQSADPWTDARGMIDRALMDLELDAGGTPSGLLLPPLPGRRPGERIEPDEGNDA